MIVLVQQTTSMTKPVETFNNLSQHFQEYLPTGVVYENILFSVSTVGDMIYCTGKSNK